MKLDTAVQAKLQVLSETYQIEGRESKGANGWLFYATNRLTAIQVAVKFYYWGDQPALHAEPRSLALFNSTNIVPILSAELVADGWACFITPRYPSDLEGAIARGGLSTFQCMDVGINVLSGMGALHASSIVHRDIKPANILLSNEGVAAIGDFGSVASLRPDTGSVPSSRHSILYRPPESFLTGMYSPPGDIYQLGLTLYEALGGYFPKDPCAWMTRKELADYEQLDQDCDRGLFVDGCMRRVITRGKLALSQGLPFYVGSKVRRTVCAMAAVDPSRRPCSVPVAMASLVAAKRSSIDWIPNVDGAMGTFSGGLVRVLTSMNGRIEIDRGRGWRRNVAMERDTLLKSVDLINARLA